VFASATKDWILGQLNGGLIVNNMTMSAASFSSTPSSSRTTLIQIHWQAQDVAAMYSAFVVDKLTIGCFFDREVCIIYHLSSFSSVPYCPPFN